MKSSQEGPWVAELCLEAVQVVRPFRSEVCKGNLICGMVEWEGFRKCSPWWESCQAEQAPTRRRRHPKSPATIACSINRACYRGISPFPSPPPNPKYHQIHIVRNAVLLDQMPYGNNWAERWAVKAECGFCAIGEALLAVGDARSMVCRANGFAPRGSLGSVAPLANSCSLMHFPCRARKPQTYGKATNMVNILDN